MPLYVYHCVSCDQEFELLQPMGKEDAEPCPVCGQQCEQVYAVPGNFVWGKGGGWN